MTIKGVGWIGVKVEDRGAASRFFEETLGIEKVRESDSRGATTFQLPDGSVIELFGPNSPEHDLHNAVVVAGIEVDDVESFRREMSARGVEFVTEIEGGPKHGQWCYFRGPEGCLFQVFSKGEAG
jgi:predicted enzyme related to lactoylglutathione lyase